VKWKLLWCRFLSYLRLPRGRCEACNLFQICWGSDIRERLQQLRDTAANASREPKVELSVVGGNINAGFGHTKIDSRATSD